mgnify:CR=1 FL=1
MARQPVTAKHTPLFLQIAQVRPDGLNRHIKPPCKFLNRHKATRFYKGNNAVAATVKRYGIRDFSHIIFFRSKGVVSFVA